MTVFVTDGAERTNLVHVGESYRFSTTALSKYSKRCFIYPYHPKKKGLEIGEDFFLLNSHGRIGMFLDLILRYLHLAVRC